MSESSRQQQSGFGDDGYFVNRNWLFLGGKSTQEVVPNTDRPLILHTGARLTHVDESFAHEQQHPFVAFVHLLRTADKNSTVFISVPFLADFMVIDELCHYADPSNSALHLNILLGPKTWLIESLESFVGDDAGREEAVPRLASHQAIR
jgi:hypothetical protein